MLLIGALWLCLIAPCISTLTQLISYTDDSRREYKLGEIVKPSVKSDADKRRNVHFVSDEEVGTLFQGADKTQQEDLIADELTEQRQTVIQAAVSSSTILHSPPFKFTQQIHVSLRALRK